MMLQSVAKLGLRVPRTACAGAYMRLGSPGYARMPLMPATPMRVYSTEQEMHAAQSKTNMTAQYIGPMRMAYYRLKLFSLSSLSVAAIFAPIFMLWPHKMEMAARLGITVTTLGASSVSTALISWIGSPYVGHMTLRRSATDSVPMHYISDGVNEVVLEDTPSDPRIHASEPYYLEMATLSWNMRSLKTMVYSPSLLRATTRPLATWELPALPPPLLLDQGVEQRDEHTVSKLVAETVDVTRGKVIGRWWARWRVTPTDGEAMEFSGTCEGEGSPVRYFYVDETQLGDEWRVLE